MTETNDSFSNMTETNDSFRKFSETKDTCFGVVMALTHRLVPSFYEMASVQMGQNTTKDFHCKKKNNINTTVNETSCIIVP